MKASIGPQALRDLYWLRGGMSARQARELVGVDRRTWRRWEAGAARIPHAAVALLKVVAGGELPAAAGTQWDGFRFVRGALYTPDGIEVTAGDVRALVYQRINGALYCLGSGACRAARGGHRAATAAAVARGRWARLDARRDVTFLRPLAAEWHSEKPAKKLFAARRAHGTIRRIA